MGEINGITLSMLPFPHFLVPGVDIDDLPVDDVNAVPTSTPASFTRHSTTSPRTTDVPVSSSSPCALILPPLLLVLAATGFLTNLAAYVVTVKRLRSHRHHHNFLHIFISNILFLLPLPFVSIARLNREWFFGEATRKALSFISATAYAACAFQLTYLTVVRCSERVSSLLKPTTKGRKLVCFLLWIAAVGTAWPTAVYDDVQEGSLPCLTEIHRSQPLILYILIDYIFPCVISIVAFIFVMFGMCKNQDEVKKIPKNAYGVKEALFYSTLFFSFWLPYQVYMLVTPSTHSLQSACNVPDASLCIGVSFCSIMPVVRIIWAVRDKSSRSKQCSADKEKQLMEENSNQTTPISGTED